MEGKIGVQKYNKFGRASNNNASTSALNVDSNVEINDVLGASICDFGLEDKYQVWWCQMINEDDETFDYDDVKYYDGDILLDISDNANKFDFVEQLELKQDDNDEEIIEVFTSNMVPCADNN